MSDRHAVTSVPVHDLLATRHSTRAFDPEYEITAAERTALLEAARWAPSCGNSQPSRFIVGVRGTPDFDRILACLTEGNRGWARHASMLVVGVRALADEKGPLPPYGDYDLGQAMAHLTFQAIADRLTVRQMAGFDKEAVAESFGLGDDYAPRTVAAVGRADDPAKLPDDLRGPDDATRSRRGLDELVLN